MNSTQITCPNCGASIAFSDRRSVVREKAYGLRLSSGTVRLCPGCGTRLWTPISKLAISLMGGFFALLVAHVVVTNHITKEHAETWGYIWFAVTSIYFIGMWLSISKIECSRHWSAVSPKSERRMRMHSLISEVVRWALAIAALFTLVRGFM